MKKAKDYLKELEEQYDILRNDYLFQHGYTDKKACLKEEGGYIYREDDGTYYKLVPVDGEDKELEQIVTLDKKCHSLKDYQYVANLFKGFAIANLIVGLVGSFIVAVSSGLFIAFLTVFYVDVVLSVILFGIAKIIEMIGER